MNAIFSLFGGMVGGSVVGVAFAAAITWFGVPFTLGADSQNTVIGVNGDIAFKAQSVGPTFGSGIAGLGYRNTGETNMDPSFMFRAKSFSFENDGNPNINWMAVLNSSGLCIGCQPQQSIPYPIDKFNIRNGNMSFQAIMPNDESGMVWRVGGEPIWFMGRLPASFGTGDDLVIYKWKNGAWTQVARWVY